jgi:pimeloyl-ACP methyl ester carboxylesterase
LKYLGFIGFLLASLAYGDQGEEHPWLESLDPGEGYKESGAKLIRLDFGLNPLERFNGKEKILLISVHGSQSEGYEWIYPLQRLDTKKSATFFYRWNDSKCYLNSAEKLNSYLSEAMRNLPELEKVVLVGHSYGGVLVTSLVETWNNRLPAEIHSIAGPIGSEFYREGCNYSPPKYISDKAAFINGGLSTI